MKNKMVVDVDSTLYDANLLFYNVSKELEIAWPETYNFWFSPSDIGITKEQITNLFRKCHSKKYLAEQMPYEGSVESLTEVSEKFSNLEIWYASSRHPQMVGSLKNWIYEHNFPQPNNVHASMDKMIWMKDIKPSVVIDDRVRTQIFARFELGAQVLSMKHPHNINLTNEVDGIYILDNWWEIGKKLNELLEKNVPVPEGRSKIAVY